MDLILAPVQQPVAACPNSWKAIVSISEAIISVWSVEEGGGKGRTERVQDLVENGYVPEEGDKDSVGSYHSDCTDSSISFDLPILPSPAPLRAYRLA